MRAVLAGLLVATGMVLAAPTTAYACSCVSAEPRQLVEWADAVVWGEVTDARVPTTGMGEAHYLLDVERVYKGEVTERVRVDSAASGASCGLEGIDAGGRYAFFLRGDGSPYTADLCGGTGLVERQQLERVVGGAEPAVSGGDAERLPVSTPSLAGMGVGTAAVAVVAALLWLRRGAR